MDKSIQIGSRSISFSNKLTRFLAQFTSNSLETLDIVVPPASSAYGRRNTSQLKVRTANVQVYDSNFAITRFNYLIHMNI